MIFLLRRPPPPAPRRPSAPGGPGARARRRRVNHDCLVPERMIQTLYKFQKDVMLHIVLSAV